MFDFGIKTMTAVVCSTAIVVSALGENRETGENRIKLSKNDFTALNALIGQWYRDRAPACYRDLPEVKRQTAELPRADYRKCLQTSMLEKQDHLTLSSGGWRLYRTSAQDASAHLTLSGSDEDLELLFTRTVGGQWQTVIYDLRRKGKTACFRIIIPTASVDYEGLEQKREELSRILSKS
ncbi:MAG: hypothetical protein PHQ27_09580, partial [Victivallales bacterium]|nr:hypothetical protein [Victivallales bacterium]